MNAIIYYIFGILYVLSLKYIIIFISFSAAENAHTYSSNFQGIQDILEEDRNSHISLEASLQKYQKTLSIETVIRVN